MIGSHEPQGSARAGSAARSTRLVVLAAVLTVLMAEVLVRAGSSRLPDPELWSTPEIQYKVDLMRERGPVRLALVGSSVLDVAVDPSRLGVSAFNASMGAASLGMVDVFTRSVVVPALSPDVVVIGVSSRELNPNAPKQAELEGRFLDAPAVRERRGTESLLETIDRRARHVSRLFEYRSVLRDPSRWWGGSVAPWGPAETTDDGLFRQFLDAEYRFDDGIVRLLRSDALHEFRVGRARVARLRSLAADLVADGREVLLLATPVTEDYVDLHPGGAAQHAAFLRAVRDAAADAGAGFADAGVWDRSLFADPLHVNRAGNRRLTDLLREWVDQNWK